MPAYDVTIRAISASEPRHGNENAYAHRDLHPTELRVLVCPCVIDAGSSPPAIILQKHDGAYLTPSNARTYAAAILEAIDALEIEQVRYRKAGVP